MYVIQREHARPEDGRVRCKVNSHWYYRSRIAYCNANNTLLEDIKGLCVHHKDGDLTNDAPENLELTTQTRHIRHHTPSAGPRSQEACLAHSNRMKRRWQSGCYQSRRSRKSKYDYLISDICREYEDGQTQVAIASMFNIPRTSVQNILRRC